MKLFCNRRNNNTAVMIAIYCSMPWLFFGNSTSKTASPSTFAEVAAICLILVAALAATFLCRRRRTA